MEKELRAILEFEPAPDSERRLAMAFAIILGEIRKKRKERKKTLDKHTK